MLGTTVIVITNLCDQYGETVRFGPYEAPQLPRVADWFGRFVAGLTELNDELLPVAFATTQLKAVVVVLVSDIPLEAQELPSAESVIHDIRTGWQAGELGLHIKA